jgi:hypothetical protein
MAASRSKDIAFIVMMAGPGVPGDQLMKQQGIDIVRANGGGDAAVKQQVEIQSKIFQILREEKDSLDRRETHSRSAGLVAGCGAGGARGRFPDHARSVPLADSKSAV